MERNDRVALAVALLFLAGLAAVFLGDAAAALTGIGGDVPFALFTILGIGLLMTLGPVAGGRGRPLRLSILAGTAALAVIPPACGLLHAGGAPAPERWLGMLPATALFLCGVLSAPFVILAAYAVLFSRSVYGAAEHERFLGLGPPPGGADAPAGGSEDGAG